MRGPARRKQGRESFSLATSRRVQVAAGIDVAALTTAARADPHIAELLAGKTIVKTIAVPGRMVNFVVK